MADPSQQPGENYYESTTMTKRDYYTLRDRGLPVQQGAAGAAAAEPQASTVARPPPGAKAQKFIVVMLDGSQQEFELDPKVTAQDLFDVSCESLCLHEKEYFGLSYCDSAGVMFWVQGDKKITSQLKKAGTKELKLELMVKFYPPDPENLRENLTRYYVALQLRQNLMAETLPCSFISYVILGSYVVQSEMGDYDGNDPNMASLDYLRDCPFCPERERTQELMETLSELHRCHRGMTPEEADFQFLVNCKKLAMYGIDMHAVKDAKGGEELVGVYHGGVVIYRNSLRINRFSWPKIIRVSHKRNVLTLVIRTGAEKDPNSQRVVELKSGSAKMAQRLWQAVVEHHGFFRLKAPEKPSKPLIPGTFKRNWNYTGPTAQQLQDQPFNAYPEVQITQGMRKSFKKKAMPTKAKMDEEFDDDAYNREQRLQQQQQQEQQQQQAAQYAQVQKGRQMAAPNLQSLRPGRWAMCPADADPFVAASLDADAGSGGCPSGVRDWQGSRANKGVRGGGQWYYETTVGSSAGSQEAVEARVGWSTETADLRLGDDADGFGFGAGPDGEQQQKYSGGLPQQYGVELRPGDVVGAFVDLDNGGVEFAVNGERLGPALALSAPQLQRPFFPAACCRDGAEMAWNFGDDPDRPLVHQPPAPWRPVAEASDAELVDNPRAWSLNPRDTTGPGLQLSPDLCCAQAHEGWQGARADRGLRGGAGGKFYFEAEPLEADGLGRVGWTTEDGDLLVGSDNQGWGYGADYEGFGLGGSQGKRLHSDEIDTYGEPFSKGDVVGCLLDLDAGVLEFSKNGQRYGPAYQLPPERRAAETYFPTVCMRDQTVDMNLGQRPFRYLPGAEWRPVALAPAAAVQLGRRAIVEAANVPSVDQKYDLIKENRQQIRPPPQPAFNGQPSVTVHESRTESSEVGDPEEEIITYVDEHGNTVRKRVTKQKLKHQVVTSKLVETRGYMPEPGASTEQLDRAMNGGSRPTIKRTTDLLSDEGEEDDGLNDMIYQQTGFSRDDVFDENVTNFSMSNRAPVHESEI